MNDGEITFILVLITLRVATALAIGIKPDHVFDLNESCT